MNARRSVLIVDSQEETQEVLRTALERQGVRILAASRNEQGLALAREHQPDLIVLDLEVDDAQTESVHGGFAAASAEHDTPVVMLGNARRRPRGVPPGRFMSKPYHYAPLIRKIEELLDCRQPAAELD